MEFLGMTTNTGGGILSPVVESVTGAHALVTVEVAAGIAAANYPYPDGEQPPDAVRYRWAVDALRAAADDLESTMLGDQAVLDIATMADILALPETSENP